MTADEFAWFADRKLFDLLDGRLTPRPSGTRASYHLGQLLSEVSAYTHRPDSGLAAFAGLACRCFPGRPDHVRWASGGVTRLDRLTPDDWHAELCPVVPDVVISAVFPDETAGAVESRVQEWLAAGAKLVWVIEPDPKIVFCHTPAGVVIRREADTLTGDPVLPGFSVPVADLFKLPTAIPA